MAKRSRHPVHGSSIEVVRVLVLLQAAIAVTATFEVAVVAAFGMPLSVPLMLTAGAASLHLLLAAGVGRRSRLARRLVLLVEVGWIASAVADLALAAILAGRLLEPVPLLTRLIVPVAVFRMLRKPGARREFGVRLSRRQLSRLTRVAATTEREPAPHPVPVPA